MNGSMTRLCELCSNAFSECNFEEIVEATRELLNVLLIQVSIDKNRRALMCQYCSDKVKLLYEFKSGCLYTEDFVSAFIDANKTQVDLKELFVNEKEHGKPTNILLDQNLCRLCMEVVVSGAGIVSLDKNESYVVFIKGLIKKCVPEVNMHSTKNAVVCDTCVHSLEDYSIFLDSCADVADKKTKFHGPQSETGQSAIEKFSGFYDATPDKSDKETFTGQENYGIKIERIEDEAFDCFQLGDHQDVSTDTEQSKYAPYNCENSESAVDNPLPVIKSQAKEHESGLKVKSELDCGTTTLENRSETEPYKKIQSKDKSRRKKCFKCDLCGYTSNQRGNLNKHTLIHKHPWEIEWFKCDSCGFKAKQKLHLRRHVERIHKHSSEVEWFQCDLCNAKFKQKPHLKRHVMSIHNYSAEASRFKCGSCDFSSKYNSSLQTHMSTHKPRSEIEWFHCDSCDYKADTCSKLKVHMSIHRDPLEVEWFSCHLCTFKSYQKAYVSTHVRRVHLKNTPRVSVECHLCDFKTHRKDHLTVHMLVHKDPSKVNWFSCDTCDYKSKYKQVLNTHMLIHKSGSEIKWFECYSCDYKAKRKQSLNRHMLLMHKEVTGEGESEDGCNKP
ncbi:hypothetical protein NQ315_007428 [Exocentrus adspersus]|uniref:C2H2-type domain-containing protein n=1 Tax=Exocentrus adspersus TaxID=1586481 RepID=A0AAV8VHA5_9CUCU|nr:hypothetical protein NQ315_007428 [Exocentrus adspersus]